MSVERGTGDLLAAQVDALVNPVNTEGAMGKGLALHFKKAFPENFSSYQRACKSGDVVVGKMHVVERPTSPRYLINFPTKSSWRKPSQLEYVELGLVDLVRVVGELGIRSIAVPALGCGLGGLDWNQVRPLIDAAFQPFPMVTVVVFEPAGAADLVTPPARSRVGP